MSMKDTLEARPDIWKYLLITGAILAFIAFILGWVGFGVPNWQGFQRYNGSTQEYYGLWAYCQQPGFNYGTICKRWSDIGSALYNGTVPSFISTSQGLITTGMIFLSLGLIAAIISALFPLLVYIASILTFLGFLFLVIGVPIFGQQSNDYSQSQGVATYNKLYGFWLMIPTIILSFLAALIFAITGYIYQKFGFGNLATHSYRKQPDGGPNMVPPIPYGMRPGFYPPMGYPPYTGPSLLSQYIARRMPKYYGPIIVRRSDLSSASQPTVLRVIGQPIYIMPAYYKATGGDQSEYTHIVNLTGRTIVGPTIRVA